MYESILKECCNFSTSKCLGGMFKVEDRKLVQWLDNEKADKPCLVTRGESCNFFNSVVIPGIPNNSSLRHTLSNFEIRAQIKASGYPLICKRCGKKFRSTTKNKQYCDNCKRNVKRLNSRNTSKKHRLKQEIVERVSA